jgi:hypothetical protein
MLIGLIAGDDDGDAVRAMFAIGIFPLFLGVSYLGLWYFGRKNSSL